MCTVTFIPFGEKVFITSNRDEKHFREPATYPLPFQRKTGTLVFPRDGDAGGTWIALHENGNALVFLNGGRVPHQPQPPYRISRGLVLLELLDTDAPYFHFLEMNLEGIEPFTAIIWDNRELYECRWDGSRKYPSCLNAQEAHIWSSVTLYDEVAINKRRQWFESWCKTAQHPTLDEILMFHQFAGDEDDHNDLLMHRDAHVFTVSITGMELKRGRGLIKYLDLIRNRTYLQQLNFTKSPVLP